MHVLTFEWLTAVPLWYAKVSALVLFAVILTLVWALPLRYVYGDDHRPVLYRDLRFWATLLLFIQFILYLIF